MSLEVIVHPPSFQCSSVGTPIWVEIFVRLLLLLIVPPILIFLCALAMLAVPLPDFFPPPWSQGHNKLSAILVGGVGGLGYLVSLILYYREPN